MALLGQAAVAMWWDMAPEHRDEFEDWHSHEHFPERMGIPGFRRGSRWADASGGEGFFICYELDDYATLTSPGYLARLNQPTPWSRKLMPHHRNMVRSQARVLESAGAGVAAAVATVRLSPVPGREAELQAHLRSLLEAAIGQRGITGGHLLRTQTPAAAKTEEQMIRGGDGEADWIALLCGYDADTLRQATQQRLGAAALSAAGAAPTIVAGVYRLRASLAAAEIQK